MESLKTAAANVLRTNWAGDHTVASRTLYPHQWSWDAAFISVGLVRIDPERAWQELRSLFEAQWPDGRVPHIVFDSGVPEKSYFPGPAFWEVPPIPGTAVRTTGIIQPPVHALAASLVHQVNPDVKMLRWLYPRLVAQQEYLAKQRDAGGAGLACIVHPWESGLDNSPAWDPTLARIPADATVLDRYTRRDTAVSVVSHRPTDADYCRFIALAQAYRDNGYRDFDLLDRHPFVVECPSFNALYADAEHALAVVADVVGADPAPHRERAAFIRRVMQERLFDPSTGLFHALDVRTHELSPARCISGLMPLLLPDLPPSVAACLVAEAGSRRFGFPGPLPSYDRTAADFDRLRYWRGPAWINMNWLLLRGLRTHGYADQAAALRQAMLDLIERSGCYEYFDPITGDGIGTPQFSWTAALALDLLASPGQPWIGDVRR